MGDKFWQATKDFALDLLGLEITSCHQCEEGKGVSRVEYAI